MFDNMQEMNSANRESWIEIVITCPPELSEALSNFMIEHGAEGVFQEEEVDPRELNEIIPRSREEIKAYLPFDSPWQERTAELKHYIEELVELFPELKGPDFSVHAIADPDWGEQWKKYFKPLRIHKNIVIKPTWERYSPSARDIVVEIDPGMAFGTGQHASTRMCLEALEEILLKDRAFKDRSSITKWRILDVGTGTGILSITCAKLGAEKVVALDIDPLATDIAHKNVTINHVGDQVEVITQDVAKYKGRFELIVANLNAEPLIKLRPHLLSLMEDGAYLIISGIIEQSTKKIEKSFLKDPLTTLNVISDKEWVCYVLKKQ
jgi:ribosomal protein L11 methyltransferase